MHFSFAILAASIVSSAVGQTFIGYPSTSKCPIADGQTSVFNATQLETLTKGGNRNLIDKSASNMATGPACQELKLPLYAVNVGNGAGSLYFVEDAAHNAFTFCGLVANDPKGGYPIRCSF